MSPRPRRVPDALKRVLWALGDGAVWAVAILGMTWIRFQYDAGRAFVMDTWVVAGAAAAIHLTLGILLGPYLIKHIRGSFEEVTAVCRAALITALVLSVWAIWLQPYVVPRSVPSVGAAVAISLMLAARFVVRSYRARAAVRREVDHSAIIYGAGVLGRRLVANMLQDDTSPFRPVAFLDDDRSKRKLRIDGIRVRGDRTAMSRVAKRYEATHLIVAIPRADAALLREVNDLAGEAGLTVKVLPNLDRLLDANPLVEDLRDIDLEDLLGRRPTELDQGAITDQLTGKVVLVTGAGGSIGSELCRQIARFHPRRLVLLDRDESALHAVQLSLTGRGLLQSEDVVLCDIGDAGMVDRVFHQQRPDVVFHAAALKHLPLLQRFPMEAWRVNVAGTLNVLRASATYGVGTFVNISTDKAANPTSILGYTKRVTERLTSHFAFSQPGRYVSVRFGNVLGSRGSVIPVFTEQIERGGPVTVTHPDVERFFMLIPEACQLVMQAASLGSDGDVLVLDMGVPVRIDDMARTLIAMSGRRDVSIEYTGLRPGEKLTEDLFGLDEEQQTPHHLLWSVRVPGLDPDDVPSGRLSSTPELIAWLRDRSDPAESVLRPA
ncbi:nucleoside-diphosphate sugar epimerase/dehydratase [uncultured Serinicoccus sp.]|uniref:polysaccharide biosynthesis protein n=1 Tax=uncultured Serinicoccus sp. TaxID=735514 RepID=UPI00261F38E9|nr:nucleoside-diphosphate sugar epimerase/dehydratase [uncultured Serinicoccus sp.]